jgi:DNA/RNA-binding domain of Phe-tRNA-synthetase-like protein
MPLVDVGPEVLALRPDAAVLAVVARGLAPGPTDELSRGWLHGAAAGAPAPDADPHVAAWREAYRQFGANPKRTRSSVDALLRRAPDGLPEINRLVDTYNAISVRHRLPVGGEDLTGYAGRPRLVRATGAEDFDTVESGEPVLRHPAPGEIIWRDDTGVTCRCWNWRQCVRTRITETTTDALFLLERLDPMPLADLRAAGHDLAVRLRQLAPATGITAELVTAAGAEPVDLHPARAEPLPCRPPAPRSTRAS